MSEEIHIPIGLRLLAAFCRICPCCIIARRWPDSPFAGQFSKIRQHCPCCRAYDRVKIMVRGERDKEEPVRIRKDAETS